MDDVGGGTGTGARVGGGRASQNRTVACGNNFDSQLITGL